MQRTDKARMTATSIIRLLACLTLCLGVGAIGALFTTPEIPTWYAGLNKPSWTPPNWVFPVVWNNLYALMGLSLWLLWDRTPTSTNRSAAIIAFCVQLALNAAWSPVFFALHQPLAALALIILLAGAILITILRAWRVNQIAASLLIPYLLWVLYASTLNAGIVVMN